MRDLPHLEKTNGQGEDPLAIQHVEVYAVSCSSENGMNFRAVTRLKVHSAENVIFD